MQRDAITKLQAEIDALREENSELKGEKSEAMRMYKHSKALEPYQAELIKMQQHIEKHKMKLIILFEGRDAAGKGSMIGSVSRFMNPKHYRVVALGKPTVEQTTQWYFQKYVEHFPSAGQVILFDRSWYNRAMVEPVFGFCTQQEHEAFFEDVIGFENSLCKQGIILIKLYLSVSKSVQAKRFERRGIDPLRQWKLSEVDLQAQGLWDEFSKKKYHMLSHSNHPAAPWYVLRSDNRQQARIEAMKLILNHVDYEDKDRSLAYEADSDIVLGVEEELKYMYDMRPELYNDSLKSEESL